MMKVCIGCEGILCGEIEDIYQFACDVWGECALGPPLSDVLVASAVVFS